MLRGCGCDCSSCAYPHCRCHTLGPWRQQALLLRLLADAAAAAAAAAAVKRGVPNTLQTRLLVPVL